MDTVQCHACGAHHRPPRLEDGEALCRSCGWQLPTEQIACTFCSGVGKLGVGFDCDRCEGTGVNY